MNTLENKIMRGIYYAYAIRLVTLPGVWQSFVMISAMIGLSYFVSIASVLQNLSQIAIGDIGTFAYNAIRTTEVWSMIFLSILVFALLSLRTSLAPRREMYSLA